MTKNVLRCRVPLLSLVPALLLLTSTALADGTLVSIDQIRPTQMGIGRIFVLYSKTKIRRSAPKLVDAVATRALPASIGPDNRFYIRDGHHWASAAFELVRENPGLASEAKLRIEVEADFRGKSWPEFAKYLYDRGVGYFTPGVRHQYPGLWPWRADAAPATLAEVYQRYLPATLGDLKDTPGRSAFGLALEKMGIVPERCLVDYIEFFMNEEFSPALEKSGVSLSLFASPNQPGASEIEMVQRFVVQSPQVVRYLLSHLRPGVEPEFARRQILSVINDFRASRLGLAPINLR